MGLFTMLLARRKHRYGLLVSNNFCPFPSSNFTSSLLPDESVRIRRGGVRFGMRPRHSDDDGDTHVPAARSSKMRLHGESEVSCSNSFESIPVPRSIFIIHEDSK